MSRGLFHRHSCNPVLLFDAEVEKYCPENFIPIKVLILINSLRFAFRICACIVYLNILFYTIQRNLEREVRQCQALVIWTDCDREGENIGFEIIDVCKAGKFSALCF